MTRYELFVYSWKDCKRCQLSRDRSHVVFPRGDLPCDVLFVGEAPGKSEDDLGVSFIGPAGHMIEGIVEELLGELDTKFSYAFANVVGCIPYGGDGKKVSVPPSAAIKKCAPMLEELIALARPKMIVTLGMVAERHLWLSNKNDIPTVGTLHPEAILRAPTLHQSLFRRKVMIAIRDGVDEYLTTGA